MFAGMIARPRATSSGRNPPAALANRDNSISGVIAFAGACQLRDGRALACSRPARRDPPFAELRQPGVDIVPLRSAAVVHAERRLTTGQRDLAHRHLDPLRAVDEHFA
jgi:hypothetical protein